MMLILSVFYSLPHCNFSLFFLLRPCGAGGSSGDGVDGPDNNGSRPGLDPERIRLQTAGAASGPRYTQQLDDPDVRTKKTKYSNKK